MKKLEFKISVPDKYTNKQYLAGQVYEFEDERANEILAARTKVTNEPYAVEYIEPVIMETVETVENVVETVEKPKRKRKTKQD